MKICSSKKAVVAEDELLEEEVAAPEAEVAEEEVTVEPEAQELLFEAADVAELVAEVTGQPVEVTVDGDVTEFAVGDETFTVEPDGTEEIVESAKKMPAKRRAVTASTNRKASGKAVRRIPRRK